MNTEPLKKAIDYCEGITALAVKINEKPNTVSMWIQRDNLPADKVIPVSEATGWQVTPNQLRPDLYPHPQDGLPENMSLLDAFMQSVIDGGEFAQSFNAAYADGRVTHEEFCALKAKTYHMIAAQLAFLAKIEQGVR